MRVRRGTPQASAMPSQAPLSSSRVSPTSKMTASSTRPRLRDRGRSGLAAQDAARGFQPGRVPVLQAPEPVLGAPEQDRRLAGQLEVVEGALDVGRAEALGVGGGAVVGLPG